MLNRAISLATFARLSKTARKQARHPAKFPKGALLADALKSAEIQFQKRGLLPLQCGSAFNPFWFVAETERNVFLWRNGLSLIQADEFEFWIDVPKLVEKRLTQLDRMRDDNPFFNPQWGEPSADSSCKSIEREYLCTLLKLIAKVDGHLHALSRVSSIMREENEGSARRQAVLLP